MGRLGARDVREFDAIKRLCYQGRGSAALRQAIGERLERHLGADMFAFLTLDPSSGLPLDAVHDCPAGLCDRAHEHAVLASPAADFGHRPPGARVFRVDELVPVERRRVDPYFAEVLRPFGFEHELQVMFRSDGRALACLLLTRRVGREPFAPAAASLLDAIVPHVTAGLRAAAAREAARTSQGAGTGVVLLGPRGGINFANEVALRLLRQPPAGGRGEHYWTAIRVVASLLARTLGPEPSLVVPSVEVVHPERRETYRVRAERVQQLDGSWRNLVLIEPLRPADRTDHLEALGLTPREAAVTLAVVRGLSTKEIVAELRLSPHTVQSHMKNVFEKLGVGSRRELAAALGGGNAAPGA